MNNIEKIIGSNNEHEMFLAYIDRNEKGISLHAFSKEKCQKHNVLKENLINFIKSNCLYTETALYTENELYTETDHLVASIVKHSTNIAYKSRRACANRCLANQQFINKINKINNYNILNSIEFYPCEFLADDEIILTYISDKHSASDAGMFLAESFDDSINIYTFDINDISKTQNYYRHIIFKNNK